MFTSSTIQSYVSIASFRPKIWSFSANRLHRPGILHARSSQKGRQSFRSPNERNLREDIKVEPEEDQQRKIIKTHLLSRKIGQIIARRDHFQQDRRQVKHDPSLQHLRPREQPLKTPWRNHLNSSNGDRSSIEDDSHVHVVILIWL